MIDDMIQSGPMTTIERSSTARWSRGGYAKPYPRPQCRYCGRAQDHDCKPVECMACGSRQCHGDGSECRVCLVGILPGWGLGYDRQYRDMGLCSYARCDNRAIARVNRARRACASHISASLAAKIAERVAHRDSGKGWEHWQWVA